MTDQPAHNEFPKSVWRYNDIYYDTENDALVQLIMDNPNASMSRLLDLAEDEILEVYDGGLINQTDLDKFATL